MEKLMLTRKLNNKSGKSIFMALFLLLVCVVVSVVIVTVAVTSVMHVDDNKTSNQEYLACSSAAELIKDSVAGSVYTYTYGQYKATVGSVSEDLPSTFDYENEETKANGMKAFVEKVSQIIKGLDESTAATGLLYTYDFAIEQRDVSDTSVAVECKLMRNGSKSYEMRFKLEAQDDEEGSHGYRMSMVVPIIKETADPKNSGVEKEYECQYDKWRTSSKHYDTTWSLLGGMSYSKKTHTFYRWDTVTTVTWESASNTALSITKGWSAYDSAS